MNTCNEQSLKVLNEKNFEKFKTFGFLKHPVLITDIVK